MYRSVRFQESSLKHRLLGSTSRVSDFGGLEWKVRICISSKFPGDAADPGATLVARSSCAAPRPAGGSEAPGPRGLGGGGRRRSTTPGPREPEQRMGSGGGPAQRARPGLEWPRVGRRRDLHTPQPRPQAPRARTHARTPSRSMGGPGSPSGPRARPGACWSGVGGVRGGGPASAGWSPVAGRWPDLQGRAKGRRSARLLGRPAPTASGSGPIRQ